jgi:hypothetical protein
MLCTYTDNIHEYEDDHQHNLAVHSIKEVPTPSYQAKDWFLLPCLSMLARIQTFPTFFHILDIWDATHNPVIASIPLYSKRNGNDEILDKSQRTIKEF